MSGLASQLEGYTIRRGGDRRNWQLGHIYMCFLFVDVVGLRATSKSASLTSLSNSPNQMYHLDAYLTSYYNVSCS